MLTIPLPGRSAVRYRLKQDASRKGAMVNSGIRVGGAYVEQAALASMLLDAEAARIASEQLLADDFNTPEHRTIFLAAKSILEDGDALDEVTLVARLKKEKQLGPAGGHEYVRKLAAAVPSGANTRAYVRILHENADARRLTSGSV